MCVVVWLCVCVCVCGCVWLCVWLCVGLPVSPAMDLVRLAARCGATVVEIKRTDSLLTLSGVPHLRVPAPAEVALPAIAAALCTSQHEGGE